MNLAELQQCQKCPRLVSHLQQARAQFPDYHNRPVAAYGASDARLLIVGLAPGKHGANASGLPFHGDASGDFLWSALHERGLANPDGERWQPIGCRVTNVVKCLPPQNRPTGDEIDRCKPYLQDELAALPRPGVVLALGLQAHGALLKALGRVQSHHRFRHAARHDLEPGLNLFDSYHCSRYNTQTGRLTRDMFDRVLDDIRRCLA